MSRFAFNAFFSNAAFKDRGENVKLLMIGRTVNAERPKNDLWKFSEEIYSISCAKTRHGLEMAPQI